MEPESRARIRRRRPGGGGVVHDAPREERAGRPRSIPTTTGRPASTPADTRCTPERTPGVKEAWRSAGKAV